MKFLRLLFGFITNLIYLTYMTFMEREDFDFEFLPFGNESLGERRVTESLIFYP
jgi:hypothetical protein